MAIITTFFGDLGLAPPPHHPAPAQRLDWRGGLLLVLAFVGLGCDLARSMA